MTAPDDAPGDTDGGPTPVEPRPAVVDRVFGDRAGLAERYAELLVTEGTVRGLLGPREAGRIWSRHLLNCAVLGEAVPADTRVVDIGSGAGLPGIALALARPDLRIDLVESMQRRVAFLDEVIDELGLGDRVRTVCGRAEDAEVRTAVGDAPWVTARAVAPLARLMRWCASLTGPEGSVALIKGQSAADEVARDRAAVRAAGWSAPQIEQCGVGIVEPPVPVVVAHRVPVTGSGGRHGRRAGSGRKRPSGE